MDLFANIRFVLGSPNKVLQNLSFLKNENNKHCSEQVVSIKKWSQKDNFYQNRFLSFLCGYIQLCPNLMQQLTLFYVVPLFSANGKLFCAWFFLGSAWNEMKLKVYLFKWHPQLGWRISLLSAWAIQSWRIFQNSKIWMVPDGPLVF